MTARFDEYSPDYGERLQRAIAFAGQRLDFFTEVKVDYLLGAVARHVGDPATCSVLDVGCGVGETDRFLAGRVGRLAGVDVAEGAIEAAARRNPAVDYFAYDGRRLPFPDGALDATFAICVVHHVPPPRWPRLVSEMTRVTRRGGMVAFFEHAPFNPLTRLVVYRCEFDDDVVLARRRTVQALLERAGLRIAERRHILFFPWNHPLLRRLDRGLGWLPLGASHLVVGLK